MSISSKIKDYGRLLGSTIVLIVLFKNFVAHILLITDAFSSTNICQRDFVQYYLTAQALASKVDMGQSLDILAKQFLPECEAIRFNHASPYPPGIAIAFLPASYVSLIEASVIWLLISTAALGLSTFLISQELPFHKRRPAAWIILFFLLVSSTPAAYELAVGNVNSLLLLLSALSLRHAKERPRYAGAVLGVAGTLKPILWPLVFFAFVGKRSRFLSGLLIGGGLALIVQVLISGIPSWNSWVHYVLSGEQEKYLFSSRNFSALTLGPRIFHGMDPNEAGTPSLQPLVQISASWVQTFSWSVSIACCAAILGYLAHAVRLKGENAIILTAILSSLLISPVAWEHHLVLLFLAAPFFCNFKMLPCFDKASIVCLWLVFYCWNEILLLTSMADYSGTSLIFWLLVVLPLFRIVKALSTYEKC